MSTETLGWVPDSCTLPTAERPLRRAEFGDLFASALSGVDRLAPTHLRLRLRGGADLEERVRDLARRESECCSFFAFTVTPDAAGTVTFDIRVDGVHVGVLDGLAARCVAVSRT